MLADGQNELAGAAQLVFDDGTGATRRFFTFTPPNPTRAQARATVLIATAKLVAAHRVPSRLRPAGGFPGAACGARLLPGVRPGLRGRTRLRRLRRVPRRPTRLRAAAAGDARQPRARPGRRDRHQRQRLAVGARAAAAEQHRPGRRAVEPVWQSAHRPGRGVRRQRARREDMRVARLRQGHARLPPVPSRHQRLHRLRERRDQRQGAVRRRGHGRSHLPLPRVHGRRPRLHQEVPADDRDLRSDVLRPRRRSGQDRLPRPVAGDERRPATRPTGQGADAAALPRRRSGLRRGRRRRHVHLPGGALPQSARRPPARVSQRAHRQLDTPEAADRRRR